MGIAGSVFSAALLIGGTIWGNKLLKKYRDSIIPEIADDNPFNGSVGYVIVGKIWLPCYLDEVVVTKGVAFAYTQYRDMTEFPRYVGCRINDPNTPLRLLKPITKRGFSNMTPAIVQNGKLVNVPFYKELPIGTRVKLTTPYLTQFKGKVGTIRRGMIFDPENKDGTYDKYKIQLDDVIDPYYEKVTNFMMYDNKFIPKHYAKQPHNLKWGPWIKPKPKIKYKQKILKQTYERRKRAEAFKAAKVKKENDYSYVKQFFDTTRDFKCHVGRRLPAVPEKSSILWGITYKDGKWYAKQKQGKKIVTLGTFASEGAAITRQELAGGYHPAGPPVDRKGKVNMHWSRYKGVSFVTGKHPEGKPWRVRIGPRGETKLYGHYATEHDAYERVKEIKALDAEPEDESKTEEAEAVSTDPLPEEESAEESVASFEEELEESGEDESPKCQPKPPVHKADDDDASYIGSIGEESSEDEIEYEPLPYNYPRQIEDTPMNNWIEERVRILYMAANVIFFGGNERGGGSFHGRTQ